MNQFAHLTEETAKLMTLPTPERIKECERDHWIGYTRALAVLGQLDDLVNYPRSLRMPNIAVVGRSGNGKSAIAERFVLRHPVQMDEHGRAIIPIVDVEIPGTPDESELWSLCLTRLSIAHNQNNRASAKLAQLKQMLTAVGARVLVLDEFNNLVRAGKAAGELLASIKNLSNELRISIAAFGTTEVTNALSLDPQLKSRFQPAILDRWTFGIEYRRFLLSYEKVLPLAEPSNLADAALAKDLHQMGGDTIGGTVKVLKLAAATAARKGTERITKQLLEDLPWTRPDEWGEIAKRA